MGWTLLHFFRAGGYEGLDAGKVTAESIREEGLEGIISFAREPIQIEFREVKTLDCFDLKTRLPILSSGDFEWLREIRSDCRNRKIFER